MTMHKDHFQLLQVGQKTSVIKIVVCIETSAKMTFKFSFFSAGWHKVMIWQEGMDWRKFWELSQKIEFPFRSYFYKWYLQKIREPQLQCQMHFQFSLLHKDIWRKFWDLKYKIECALGSYYYTHYWEPIATRGTLGNRVFPSSSYSVFSNF